MARRCFDGLEVQPVDGTIAYERFDLSDDLRVEGRFEAPFLAPSSEVAAASNCASAHCSHARQYVSTRRRNCFPARTCSSNNRACTADT